jgi:hypothetical protein
MNRARGLGLMLASDWQGLKKALSIKPEEAIIEMCIKKHASLQ